MYAKLISTGSYLPEKILTNKDLESMVETSDEWIRTRSGIEQRHIVGPNEETSDLAVNAASRALANAGLHATDVDLLVVATTTPDVVFPSTACIVQDKLGAKNAAAFDIQAVCSGFVYALSIVDKMIASGSHKTALIIGAEVYSRILNWKDRATCVLFGDGAGAVVVTRGDAPGILATKIHSDGSRRGILNVPGQVRNGAIYGDPFVHMDGQAVFKFAVGAMADVCNETQAAAGVISADIDWLVPHQANVRIIDATAKRLGVPAEKSIVTVNKHGNTSAASIPLALDIAAKDGRLKRGDLVQMVGVGGGFTWGSVLARWG
ncbi:MAG: ketoacyl-ACP synthase III [Burkholderiales bacterium]|nr:MAG: ketoacyl-ACP synthase III [Burkholderiales bacterium]TAG77183.1 MAG: ketoacyl-ACP synthase III [Betaproteobacteria bacterium]